MLNLRLELNINVIENLTFVALLLINLSAHQGCAWQRKENERKEVEKIFNFHKYVWMKGI